MTSKPISSDQLHSRLAFRGEISPQKLAKSLQALPSGEFVFVATRSRPNPRRDRLGLLAFLGFKPGARWRTRKWTILPSDHFKKLPDGYKTFLDTVDFRK